MVNPNWVAYLALVAWPLVALYLYAKFPAGRAIVWTILGAYLLLPVDAAIKFTGIPAFDKNSIPNLAALLCCGLFVGRLPRLFRGFGIAETLILGILLGPFITSVLNSDPIQIGATFLPGVGPYDALSAAAAEFIFIIPFFIGRDFLRSPASNVEILRALTIGGLAYSIPMLLEIRVSPQLHVWVYGYFPSDFIQEVRDGGFRPVVFLGHGLLVAFFAMTAAVAAAALWRTNTRTLRLFKPGVATAYLTIILVLCKTASATLYGALLVPLVRWLTPRKQLRVASILALIALSYPVLRAADLLPTSTIISVASSLSADRAASLKTRFDNEDQLLNRASERPWFGWGRFGRNRVYNGWNGGDSSVTDGTWIITMGVFGIVGFVAQFGLLGLTVFRATGAVRYAQQGTEACYLAALALIVAINMIDLLPNSSIRPWTWLLAGALLGRAEAVRALAQQPSVGNLNVRPMPVQEA